MSSSSTLVVHVSEPVLTNDEQVMVRLVATCDSEQVASVCYWSPVDGALPMVADGRTALLTFLPLAMRLGMTIEAADSVDAMTLLQLQQWQQIMARWHPGRLQTVQVRSQRVAQPHRPETSRQMRALMGFSGGVDSCHTLWRHSASRGVSPLSVQTGLLVQGMDIPLHDRRAFESAKRRAETMLHGHGAALQTVATDIRELERQFDLSWETHTHGIVLAACLSLYESSFDAVLIASTYSAQDLKLPWGSNPVTDTMLGGGVPYIHDGSACNKLAKVMDFAMDPSFPTYLRVCWEGQRKDANCGRCFKCLTTQASLWLSGVPSPPAFDRPAQVQDLATLPIKNAVNQRLVEDIQSAAVQRNRDDISQALLLALKRSPWGARSALSPWKTGPRLAFWRK